MQLCWHHQGLGKKRLRLKSCRAVHGIFHLADLVVVYMYFWNFHHDPWGNDPIWLVAVCSGLFVVLNRWRMADMWRRSPTRFCSQQQTSCCSSLRATAAWLLKRDPSTLRKRLRTSKKSVLWLQLKTGWWFQTFLVFIPIWWNHPIWLVFFKRVETAN